MDEAFLTLLRAFEALIQTGENIPEEVFQEMTNLLLMQIQRMQQGTPVAVQGTPATQVPSAPYPSSNIFGFQYDPASEKLLIKFMGKDTAQSGPVYSYGGVPPYIFEVLRRGAVAPKTTGKNKYHAWYRGVTPSHGASVYALIKEAGFPYRRVA